MPWTLGRKCRWGAVWLLFYSAQKQPRFLTPYHSKNPTNEVLRPAFCGLKKQSLPESRDSLQKKLGSSDRVLLWSSGLALCYSVLSWEASGFPTEVSKLCLGQQRFLGHKEASLSWETFDPGTPPAQLFLAS